MARSLAPAHGAWGLLLLGLALATHGEDDAVAFVQRGLHARGPGDVADMDGVLPDWVNNIIGSFGVEDLAQEEEDLSEEDQADLDKEAESGSDLDINFTKMEEQAGLEEQANSTAPMLKWLFLDTASYAYAREYTMDNIQGEWRYAGRPGRFSINSNPQGEIIYHTPLNEEHDAVAILLPIDQGAWLLEGVVQDPNRTGLSRVRVQAMNDPGTLVVGFAGLNGTNWSFDVPATRSNMFEKLIPLKSPPKVMRKKAEQEDLKSDPRDRMDKDCWGPMVFTAGCIKKHGLHKKSHGSVDGLKANTLKAVKKLAGFGGDGLTADTAQEMSSQLNLDEEEDSLGNMSGILKRMTGGKDLHKFMDEVLDGASVVLDANASELLGNLLGSLPPGADVNGMLQGLLGGTGTGPSVAQTFMNLFNNSDRQYGELPIEALHRKFKAFRYAAGLTKARDEANGASAAAGSNVSGTAATLDGLPRVLSKFYDTEEYKTKALYGTCGKKGLGLANYTLANHTPQGLQMWWPYELDDRGMDFGWLLDNWQNVSGVNVGSPLPEDGVITGWEWYGSGTHETVAMHPSINDTAHFQVLRWVPSITGRKFKLIGQSTAKSTVLRARNRIQLDPKDYIPVKKGDFIGFYYPGRAVTGYVMAPKCEVQMSFTAPPFAGTKTVGETTDYMLAIDPSPRAYHFHAQYLSKSAGSDSGQVTTLWRDR